MEKHALDPQNTIANLEQFKHLSKDDIVNLQSELISLRSYAGLTEEATIEELSNYLSEKLPQLERIESGLGEQAKAGELLDRLSVSIIGLAKINPKLTIREAREGLAVVSLDLK
jgi:hypothetical protein